MRIHHKYVIVNAERSLSACPFQGQIREKGVYMWHLLHFFIAFNDQPPGDTGGGGDEKGDAGEK